MHERKYKLLIVYLLYVASPILVNLIMGGMFSLRNNEQKIRRVLLITCGIIMTLMIGLRSPYIGSGDTYRYMRNWNYAQNISFGNLGAFLDEIDFEKGYLISVWILSHIFKHPQWLLFLSGAFFSYSVCSFIDKNCKNVVLPLVIFNCLGLFNFMVQGLRQGLAMCICLFAIEFVKKRKFIPFIFLIALACTFHASAVVFVVVYFLYKFKIKASYLSFFAVAVLIVFNSLPFLFELMNSAIEDDYQIGQGAESGGVVAILIYAAIIIFGMVFQEKDNPHYPMFVYMTIIGLVAMVMRNSVSTIAERISHYYSFAQMVLVSNSIGTIKDRDTNLIVNIVVAILCLAVAVHKTSYSNLIPYLFFWQSVY